MVMFSLDLAHIDILIEISLSLTTIISNLCTVKQSMGLFLKSSLIKFGYSSESVLGILDMELSLINNLLVHLGRSVGNDLNPTPSHITVLLA